MTAQTAAVALEFDDEHPETKVNEGFDSVGQGLAYARKPDDDSGLQIGIAGGDYSESLASADTPITCTDNDDTYIVAHRTTGVITGATTTTNWNATTTYGRIGIATFASGVLTEFQDLRWGEGGVFDHSTTSAGTVTNTGGSLTANAVVLGAGSNDAKVVAGITTDGTSAVNLGVAGASVGKVVLSNATSGSITIQPATGALGTVTLTAPAVTGTLAVAGAIDSDDVTYAPTTLADWDGSADPGDVEQALDQLAERVTDLEVGGAGDEHYEVDGTPGSDDTWGGRAITGVNAGATIAQWEAVYMGSGGEWLLADATDDSAAPCRGVAAAAGTDNNPMTVVTEGVIRNDAWAWTVGGQIYLSTTAGGLTQTAPSASGEIVQQVGFAISADVMYLCIGAATFIELD